MREGLRQIDRTGEGSEGGRETGERERESKAESDTYLVFIA